MSGSKPRNGMARAYLITRGWAKGRICTWNAVRRCWDSGHDTSDYVHFEDDTGGILPIAEWYEMDRDNPPEFVMVPNTMLPERTIITPLGRCGSTWSLEETITASKASAVYQREDSHPSVLRRVWMRETKPSILLDGVAYNTSDVDWASVHRGDFVPPGRVVVPRRDCGGDVMGGCLRMRVRVDGEILFVYGTAVLARHAAHYSPSGHLVGYRTREGWKDVSPATGGLMCRHGVSGLADCQECAEDKRYSGIAQEGMTQSDMPPQVKREPQSRIIAMMREKKAAEMAYLETGIYPDTFQGYLAGLRKHQS